jgi:aminoglycoside phosphotransferase (APT) family kinase protein
MLAIGGGVPAPLVLLRGDQRSLIADRDWFVMERLPGRPVLGGIEIVELLRNAPFLLRRLPAVTATTQILLHRVDPAPLIDALGEDAFVDRWLVLLEERVREDAPGLAGGLDWLVANRPPHPDHPALCHGDLWGGNLLVERGRVTGVIDWTLATVAEPALDVGFTTMSLFLAPIPAGRRLRAALRVGSRWLGRRYVSAYQRNSDADLSNVPYYEALRCAIELTGVIAYRGAALAGTPYDSARPSWDVVADDMVAYFLDHTGVELELPPPVDA